MVKEAVVRSANEAVVSNTLSQEMIKAGESLVAKLDKLRFIIDAALWFYLPEEQVWRLVIASPEVGVLGPQKAYKQVQNALGKLDEDQVKIPLKDITVVDTKDTLINLFGRAMKTGRGISGIRFSRSSINGVPIEDAYIYRMA